MKYKLWVGSKYKIWAGSFNKCMFSYSINYM
jgi:hypothetical protein